MWIFWRFLEFVIVVDVVNVVFFLGSEDPVEPAESLKVVDSLLTW